MPNLNYSALARFSNDYTDVFNEALRQNGGNPLTSDEKRRLMDEWNKVQKQSNSGSSSSSTSGTGTVSTGSAIKDVGTASLNAVMGLLKTQESQSNTYLPNLQDQLVGIDDLMEKIKTGTFTLQGMGKTLVEMVAKGMESYYARQTKLLEEVNSKALLTGDLSRDFRETITDANPRLVQLGISFAEVADAAISIVNESGRFALVNQQTLEKAGEVGKAYLGSMQDMVSLYDDFEKIGIGAQEANSAIERAGKRSMELGLQSKKVIGDLAQNMDKINSYGFKNGIDGLATMARKATEFRMSMNEVFQIADKVMNPEGALELSANLQVLGGAIGDFNDPLKLMYMATNNVEGLQDALIGAAESLAVYSEENGKFEITGVNLRRARAMADELGMSYQDLSNMAIAAAERTSASADLMAAGVSVDETQMEFLTNIARMGKDGKMVIEVPPSLQEQLGKTVELEDLNQTTANAILENQKAFEKMDVKDIALEQFTETQKMALNISQVAAMLKVEFAKTYRGMGAEMDTYVARANDMLEKYVTGESASGELKTVLDEQRAALQKAVSEDQKSKGATPVPAQSTPVNNATNTNTTTQNTTPQNTTPSTVNLSPESLSQLAEKMKGRPIETTVNVNQQNPREY